MKETTNMKENTKPTTKIKPSALFQKEHAQIYFLFSPTQKSCPAGTFTIPAVAAFSIVFYLSATIFIIIFTVIETKEQSSSKSTRLPYHLTNTTDNYSMGKKVSTSKPNAKPRPKVVLVWDTRIMAGIICLGCCPSGRNFSTACRAVGILK